MEFTIHAKIFSFQTIKFSTLVQKNKNSHGKHKNTYVRCHAVLKKVDIFKSLRSTSMDSSNSHGLMKRIFGQGKLL